MTVTSSTVKTTLVADGVATIWAYDFYAPSNNEIHLYTITSADVATEVFNFTVLSRTPTGGTVRYPNSGAALAAGNRLSIVRAIPHTQPFDIINQSAFYPEGIERGLDWLEMQIQQQDHDLSRVLKLYEHSEDGSGAYNAKQNQIQNMAAGATDDSATTVEQVQQMISDAGALPPGLPIPTAGQEGQPLLANAVGGVGWGSTRAKFRRWLDPIGQGSRCMLEDYGLVSSTNVSDVAVYNSSFNGTNAAANVAAFNAVMALASPYDEFILPPGWTPMNAAVELPPGVTLRGRPNINGDLVLCADIDPGTPFVDCGIGTLIEDICFWVADGLTTGTAIACGNIAVGGGQAPENNHWRNLRSSFFNTGVWYAGFAILAENGPANYGSRSVVIDTIHAGGYNTYGMAFAGCNAMRGTNLYFVDNYTPSVASFYVYSQVAPIPNQTNDSYFSGGGFGDIRINGGGSNTIHCAVANDIAFGSLANSNTLFVGNWAGSGAVDSGGTANWVYSNRGVWKNGAFVVS